MPRWTEEARRKQAEIQKERRSWQHSTGPKTDAGKARSRLNSWKDGFYCKSAKDLRLLLVYHSQLLRDANRMITMEKRLGGSLESSFPTSLRPAIKASCFPEQDKIRSQRNEQTKSPDLGQDE